MHRASRSSTVEESNQWWLAVIVLDRRSDGAKRHSSGDQDPIDCRNRVHLRDEEEQTKRPRPDRIAEIRSGGTSACRVQGRALMAKKSKIEKNDKRMAVVEKYAERRCELKRIIKSPSSTAQEQAMAQRELARQPRDASAVRVRNRDAVDGRPRGHLRKFGLSRVRVRELAHRGELPGVRKSSW